MSDPGALLAGIYILLNQFLRGLPQKTRQSHFCGKNREMYFFCWKQMVNMTIQAVDKTSGVGAPKAPFFLAESRASHGCVMYRPAGTACKGRFLGAVQIDKCLQQKSPIL